MRDRFPDQTQRLYLTLLIFAAALLATALVIFQNNSMRTFPIFFFLLFLGAGIMLALGVTRGVLAGLLMISAWIGVKQLLGVWEEARLLDHLLELIMVGLTFIFAGRHHDRLKAILNAYEENQNQLKQLDLEEKAVGLLKSAIGVLRLNEEEERSVRYRRPFALILILVYPIPGLNGTSNENASVMRAIATSVKDTTRETDIPFLVEENMIAVILPETETTGANKVINNIFNRMTSTQFVTSSGRSMYIQTRAHLRFGFAAFLGASSSSINMLQAAESSLKRSREINSPDLFQNVFIEWTTVGEVPISTPLLEKVVV